METCPSTRRRDNGAAAGSSSLSRKLLSDWATGYNLLHSNLIGAELFIVSLTENKQSWLNLWPLLFSVTPTILHQKFCEVTVNRNHNVTKNTNNSFGRFTLWMESNQVWCLSFGPLNVQIEFVTLRVVYGHYLLCFDGTHTQMSQSNSLTS